MDYIQDRKLNVSGTLLLRHNKKYINGSLVHYCSAVLRNGKSIAICKKCNGRNYIDRLILKK